MNWMNIALLVCVAIALGVGSYILYTRFFKKKKNTNNTTNKGANTTTANRRANNANTANTAPPPPPPADVGLDDDFGADDFGDFDAPPQTTR
jgi:hypothetical protein